MQITEKLMERFMKGHCSSVEAVFVTSYFRNNPEAWKKYMIGSWNEEVGKEELPYNYKELMLQEIRQKTFHSPAANKGRLPGRIGLRLIAVAASVLLVFSGIWLYKSENAKQKYIAHTGLRSAGGKETIRAIQTPIEWRLNANRTDQKLKMKLEDGSVVTLLPHSSIRYAKHFADNTEHTRDIFLKGQAFFEVARDKSRPFSVYAGNIATTVLGTSFSVHENKQGVLVKLYSGKVMVHAVEPKLKAWRKEIFLTPGEQLRFQTGAELAIVSSFATEKPQLQKTDAGIADDHGDMVFDNIALPEVMNKLIRHYHTPIEYKKTELADMYFSGSVLKTDSLSVILKVIANMNGLQITQTTDGFMLHPSKE